MNGQTKQAMQMALGAMLTAQNTLIFKCGGDMRPMERETLDDLVEAITSVQMALAQPQGEDDLTIAYMVGYEKGKDETKEKAAKVCENVVSNEGYVQAEYCAAAIRSMK